MTSLLSMLDRFEQAAVTYETSTKKADREELHAARRAIMEAFAAPTQPAPTPDLDGAMDAAYSFIKNRLEDVKVEKGLAGLWCMAFRAGWTAATPSRPCTCHQSDNPPVPCAEKYALSECTKDAAVPHWQVWEDDDFGLAGWVNEDAEMIEHWRSKGRKVRPLYASQPSPAIMEREAELVKALTNVRDIISDGAMTGFNWKDGDWADRLYASQQQTSRALRSSQQNT